MIFLDWRRRDGGNTRDSGGFVWNGVSVFLSGYSINLRLLYLSYPPSPFHTQLFQKRDTVKGVGNEDLYLCPCGRGFRGTGEIAP